MEFYSRFIDFINGYLWGPPLLILLIGTHLFMTIRTGFIQRKIGTAIKLSVKPDPEGTGDISQFAALTTALASTIGTGNIVGVGTAIALGGPGAVLWMWLTGVFGIATKYAESLIAVKYRVRTENGDMLGGAMYALERGLNAKWAGVLFALFAMLASFGIGSSVQANATAHLIKSNFNVSPYITGAVLFIIIGLIIIGGLKRISKVCEMLVPFMAIIYVLGCIVILIINRSYLLDTVKVIFTSAFSAKAAGGGFLGVAILTSMRYGIARGLFSNESGMGSAPIVAAAAKTKNPVRQALVSSTGTFWDTVVVCAFTGLVLVSTIISTDSINLAEISGNGGTLTSLAFSKIGTIGPIILTFGMITFATSTILGWSYYGDRCTAYLFGNKAVLPYRIIYTITVFAGSIMGLNVVWATADALNALMTIPNIIAILLLSTVIAKEGKKYLRDLDKLDDSPIPLKS